MSRHAKISYIKSLIRIIMGSIAISYISYLEIPQAIYSLAFGMVGSEIIGVIEEIFE